MDNLKRNQNNYKGKIVPMSVRTKGKAKGSNKSMVQVPISFMTIFLTVLLGLFGWMCREIYRLNATAEVNTASIQTLENQMNSVLEYMLDINKQISQMNPEEDIIISASNELSSSLSTFSITTNLAPNVTSSLSSDICVGTDSSGKIYFADELVNKTILLTYEEEDKDVFFLGQYNENYHWNGYCVTNAYYRDGVLYGICESNFEDGKRLDYETIVSIKENEWDYYSRTSFGNINSGTSITYLFQDTAMKKITDTNVRAADILYVDSFIETQNAVMLQYYYGNTTDGKYNDTTGNAYLVKYYEDETVKTLYVGNFINGTFNDDTGNAWNLVYAEDLEYYVYHTGIFKNGSAIDNTTEPVSQRQIDEIVSAYDFDCMLKWKE